VITGLRGWSSSFDPLLYVFGHSDEDGDEFVAFFHEPIEIASFDAAVILQQFKPKACFKGPGMRDES